MTQIARIRTITGNMLQQLTQPFFLLFFYCSFVIAHLPLSETSVSASQLWPCLCLRSYYQKWHPASYFLALWPPTFMETIWLLSESRDTFCLYFCIIWYHMMKVRGVYPSPGLCYFVNMHVHGNDLHLISHVAVFTYIGSKLKKTSKNFEPLLSLPRPTHRSGLVVIIMHQYFVNPQTMVLQFFVKVSDKKIIFAQPLVIISLNYLKLLNHYMVKSSFSPWIPCSMLFPR